MEDKVAKLSERAPEEARKLMKRVAFAVITAVAGLAVRKLVDKLWERATGELPPTKVMREDEAVERLLTHPYFEPNVTPIQLLNRATDPMLQAVKPRLFEMLRLLAKLRDN